MNECDPLPLCDHEVRDLSTQVGAETVLSGELNTAPKAAGARRALLGSRALSSPKTESGSQSSPTIASPFSDPASASSAASVNTSSS